MYKSVDEVKNDINKNYKAFAEMTKAIETAGSVSEKLSVIEVAANFLSENITGLYSSRYLEDKLRSISKESIFFEEAEHHKADGYLIVMTSASYGGGSTVLVNNWIRWDTERKYSVVFINMKPKNVPDFLKKAVEKSNGKLFFLRGSFTDKAYSLIRLSKCFKKVISFHHQADIIPNLAYSNPAWTIPVLMYNHANFRFSLGYETADFVLNLNDYDKEKTMRFRGVKKEKNEKLQFPNAGIILTDEVSDVSEKIDKEAVRKKYNIDFSKKLVVTMGEQFKLDDVVGCSFTEFANNLVKRMDGKAQYIIIGPNPETKKWKELSNSTNGLARAVGYIPREEAHAIISMADFFVPSFPMLSNGANTAEEFKIPYMGLGLMESISRKIPGKTVKTVEELENCVCDSLTGNSDKYKSKSENKWLLREEWISEWNRIDAKAINHECTSINPEQIIDEEEIISQQLMGKSPYYNIFCDSINLSDGMYKRLHEIGINMGVQIVVENNVSRKRINELDFLCFKNMKLFEYTSRWMRLESKGVNIADYLLKNGFNVLSIYGMGLMGRNLYEVLKASKIKIECMIDGNTKKTIEERKNYDAKVLDLNEVPKESKIIINTAVTDNENVRNDYFLLPTEIKIVSIFDVIEAMEKEIMA